MVEISHPFSAMKSGSPEGVALELMEMIFVHEVVKPTRDDILSTYADCLSAVRGNYQPTGQRSVGVVAAALAEEA